MATKAFCPACGSTVVLDSESVPYESTERVTDVHKDRLGRVTGSTVREVPVTKYETRYLCPAGHEVEDVHAKSEGDHQRRARGKAIHAWLRIPLAIEVFVAAVVLVGKHGPLVTVLIASFSSFMASQLMLAALQATPRPVRTSVFALSLPIVALTVGIAFGVGRPDNLAEPKATQAQRERRVTFASGCTARVTKSVQGEIVGYLEPKREYSVIESDGAGWRKVTLGEKSGWVFCKPD